jgi:DNA primase
MNRIALDELKQQISLLEYPQAHDWQQAKPIGFGRLLGLYPLHADHKPSFLVDPTKTCATAMSSRRRRDSSRRTLSPLRAIAAAGRTIDAATPQPALGYPLQTLRQTGLVTACGYDTYTHRVAFPLEGNLYGRSLSAAAPPHRFLPGAKGGLYSFEQVRQYPEVILVEGLFDYAVLWQADIHNATCSMGNHLNAHQYQQLCDLPRTVYLGFDAEQTAVVSGRRNRLPAGGREQGMNVRRVSLPDGHDPNSFFVENGDARQFQALLEAARS